MTDEHDGSQQHGSTDGQGVPGELPTLPWSYRPLGIRVVLAILTAGMLAVAAVVWVSFPPDIRSAFTGPQLLTLVALLGLALAGVYGLGRCRVRATEAGVDVVNVFRRRHLDWAEILRVTQRPGDPWAVLDLADGTTSVAMAIQSADGVRARRALERLAGLVEYHTRTPRDD